MVRNDIIATFIVTAVSGINHLVNPLFEKPRRPRPRCPPNDPFSIPRSVDFRNNIAARGCKWNSNINIPDENSCALTNEYLEFRLYYSWSCDTFSVDTRFGGSIFEKTDAFRL